MPPPVKIQEIIKELKTTAEHMNNLAFLLERANEFEELQSKLNKLLTDPALANALLTMPNAQTTRTENPTTAPQSPSEGPKTNPISNPIETSKTPPAPAKRDSEVKTTQAVQTNYKQQIIEHYTSLDISPTHMKEPPESWTEAKAKAAIENPTIHPDSLTCFGTVENHPWTWTQVNYIVKHCQTETPEEMAPNAGHTAQIIRELIESLNLNLYTPDETNTPKSRPNLEQYLPENIRHPSQGMRLKAFRIMSELNYEELSELSEIKKKQLQKFENGNLIMSLTHQAMLTRAMDLSQNALSSMPITDVLSLDDTYDTKSRLKTIRIRYAMTEQEFANRIGMSREDYIACEKNGARKEQVDRICMALKINPKVFEDLFPVTNNVSVSMSTGEKLRNMRNKRRMTLNMLSRASGVSLAYISNIENGKHNPSEDIVTKLALAMECTVNDIIGDQNLGIKPIKTT